jgi:hypothetical protein
MRLQVVVGMLCQAGTYRLGNVKGARGIAGMAPVLHAHRNSPESSFDAAAVLQGKAPSYVDATPLSGAQPASGAACCIGRHPALLPSLLHCVGLALCAKPVSCGLQVSAAMAAQPLWQRAQQRRRRRQRQTQAQCQMWRCMAWHTASHRLNGSMFSRLRARWVIGTTATRLRRCRCRHTTAARLRLTRCCVTPAPWLF